MNEAVCARELCAGEPVCGVSALPPAARPRTRESLPPEIPHGIPANTDRLLAIAHAHRTCPSHTPIAHAHRTCITIWSPPHSAPHRPPMPPILPSGRRRHRQAGNSKSGFEDAEALMREGIPLESEFKDAEADAVLHRCGDVDGMHQLHVTRERPEWPRSGVLRADWGEGGLELLDLPNELESRAIGRHGTIILRGKSRQQHAEVQMFPFVALIDLRELFAIDP
eukprot:CAMPEP_0181221588 /NCGR_PEP_ID=MMETSP1096-20121128/29492_1 /TAXON_ID=156174 ORGANISM="Chrysochromulina ericina, Strain CCMP281" /NCGR_SAMPLE_ID=MMETSP1096 /ASSEMBLY_ACC=CAM_ASM_000453 /LENGTH=223 /DNA_ID=CAMNT_0023314251 /DNA_START=282 /DNA_END=954 /DNA_ORIENTATION=+